MSAGASDEGESTWGYRVLAFPLAEKNLAVGIWLASLFADRLSCTASGLPNIRLESIFETLLEVLDKAQSIAPPHTMHLHSLTARLVPVMINNSVGISLLATHPTFGKLTAEATHRHAWETRLCSNERGVDGAHRPVSSYLGSLSELLACRSAALQSHTIYRARVENRSGGREGLRNTEGMDIDEEADDGLEEFQDSLPRYGAESVHMICP